MPGPVGHQDGVFGADGVQVLAAQETVLRGLGVVELEALDPFAGGRHGNPFAQGVLDVADGRQRAIGGHDVTGAAAEYVDVGVDEAGQHRLAGEVHYLGARTDERFHVGIAAHADETAIPHGNGRSAGLIGIDGDDVGATDDGVGVIGGHG